MWPVVQHSEVVGGFQVKAQDDISAEEAAEIELRLCAGHYRCKFPYGPVEIAQRQGETTVFFFKTTVKNTSEDGDYLQGSSYTWVVPHCLIDYGKLSDLGNVERVVTQALTFNLAHATCLACAATSCPSPASSRTRRRAAIAYPQFHYRQHENG